MFKQINTNGDMVGSCYKSCPTGTLPYTLSMYYLNENMFSSDEIDSQINSIIPQSDTVYDPTKVAIALDGNLANIYSTSKLPWKITKGVPYKNFM